MTEQQLNYRSVHELNLDVLAWSRKLDTSISLVVGVPRSGLLVATLLGLHMHRPVVDLRSFLADAPEWSGRRLGSRAAEGTVLIVDDTVFNGLEMARVRAAVAASPTARARDITYAAVYATESSVEKVDTYFQVLPQPRAFEWNIMHHEGVLLRACMDIDGVLNPDPTADENDDGPRYVEFLETTELRYRPSYKVSTLVTSRLEKYRPQTEAWLARHNVLYDTLIMLDLPTAEERRRLNAHAPHKAKAYLESGNTLFIESSPWEAKEIARLTGKAVFVTENREFISAAALSEPHVGLEVDRAVAIAAAHPVATKPKRPTPPVSGPRRLVGGIARRFLKPETIKRLKRRLRSARKRLRNA